MYDFNLLVSYGWRTSYHLAKKEIADLLNRLGEESPEIRSTLARGIVGVKTSLDPREIISKLREIFKEDPWQFEFTLKWVPIDLWTYSEMEAMKEVVKKLKEKIGHGERWAMKIEKRRYTKYHKIEIIKELAELIDEEVDLENPDKVLKVDILGKYAGLAVLKPEEVFSTTRP